MKFEIVTKLCKYYNTIYVFITEYDRVDTQMQIYRDMGHINYQ